MHRPFQLLTAHTFALTLAALTIALPACKQRPDHPLPVPDGFDHPPVIEPVALPDPTTPPAEPATPTTAPADPSPTHGDAAAIGPMLAGDRYFHFVLRESPGALAIQTARCAQLTPGDTAKQAACLAETEKEAGTEGIRFEKHGEVMSWVSFGLDAAGKEEIYLRGPIQVLDSPREELRFRPAGPFVGKQAADAKLADLPAGKFLTVRRVDAQTVEMEAPPPKGRLVYRAAEMGRRE